MNGSDNRSVQTEEPIFIISSSPHIHSGSSITGIMADVILAMIPAFLTSLWFFRWNALRLVLVCVISCVLSEFIARKIMRRNNTIQDLSAVVTGILLAFNLPPDLPSWMAALGSFFAIVIAKQLFGGIGYNPFNPALIGRVFLLISFPVQMTTWSRWTIPTPLTGTDAVTTATPLGLVKTSLSASGNIPFVFDTTTAWNFFIGIKNGCIGEVSALAIIIGGIYLLYRKCICWHIPLSFLGTIYLFTLILYKTDPSSNMPPLFHILTGGAMLGAWFMATDMVTSPVTKKGMIVFGCGCGLLTVIIRKWGGYPEGVSFAILLMNAITPLINRFTRPRVFGHYKGKRIEL